MGRWVPCQVMLVRKTLHYNPLKLWGKFTSVYNALVAVGHVP